MSAKPQQSQVEINIVGEISPTHGSAHNNTTDSGNKLELIAVHLKTQSPHGCTSKEDLWVS